MSGRKSARMNRRQLLRGAGTGALVIAFNLGGALRAMAGTAEPLFMFNLEDHLKNAPEVDSWLKIDDAGNVTFFTGRVELGQGIVTSLAQVVADELYVPFSRISAVSGDTERVPDQGATSGSTSTAVAGMALRLAAAEARLELLEMAAQRLGVPATQLRTSEGKVFTEKDASLSVSYAELVSDSRFERRISGDAPVRDPRAYEVVGQPVARMDLPIKLTAGKGDYVENERLPGMLHARLVRAPSYGGRIDTFPEGEIMSMPGVVAVIPFAFPGDAVLARVEGYLVADGDFIAVVAEREEQAIDAMQRLQQAATWTERPSLETDSANLHDWMLQGETQDQTFRGDPRAVVEARLKSADHVLERTYAGPFMSPAPLAPACSLVDATPGRIQVLSGAQSPFECRWMVAQALGVDAATVHVKALATSGMYGRRDATEHEVDVEAALISRKVGKPVRLVWTRQQEFEWGPCRQPHVIRLKGGLEMSDVTVVSADVWYATRSDVPYGGVSTMGLTHLNAYGFGSARLATHRVQSGLRTGYVRNVFHLYNLFAMESFVDEMANIAGEDPLQFRLRHLNNRRAREVIQAVAERADWSHDLTRDGRGTGMAFVAYDSWPAAVYLAYVAEVEVDRATGEVRVDRIVAAIDPGLVINPDGLRNQIEGGSIQATSWALKEELRFDHSRIISNDWYEYPVLRFPEIPKVETVVISRPEKPAMGAGEPVTAPVAPAIANAIFNATGARMTEMPFTPERVKATIERV